jgi:uncharacterized protein YodC (DUF2158 family)
MADSKYKVGDTLQLKSGGPHMTVVKGLEDGYWTSWFAGKKHEKAFFPFDAVHEPDKNEGRV